MGGERSGRGTRGALGISCTFTPGSATRDDTVFTWSDRDLTDWLVGTCDNRDLVWRWDFRKGAPAEQQFEDVLVALLPVWVLLEFTLACLFSSAWRPC